MAGRDRKIDPTTKDYVSDEAGGYETVTDARTAIYLAIQGERGRWWGNPTAGSRLWELAGGKSLDRITSVEIADALRQALQGLVDAERITEPEIVTERDGNRVLFEVVTVDRSNGESIAVSELISAGP